MTVRTLPVTGLLIVAVAYVAVAALNFPDLIRWENADSDVVSAFTLTQAIAAGHAGPLVLSTQGSWIPLLWGLATAGLPLHRLIWELSPTLLVLAAAGLLGATVARLAGRAAGLVAVVVMVCASPVTLVTFTSAFFHNTTVPGAIVLDAYLVWLTSSRARPAWLLATAAPLAVTAGAFVASDELLAVAGLFPFAVVALLMWFRTRDSVRLAAGMVVTIGALVIARVIASVTTGMHLRTTTPPVHFSTVLEGHHLKWLLDGLLRLSGGLALGPQSAPRTVLTDLVTVVTVIAAGAVIVLATRTVRRPVTDRREAARVAHVAFWSTSLMCTAAAYVLTTVALAPSDRYLITIVPAFAALVPLLMGGRRAATLVCAGLALTAAANLVAVSAGDPAGQIYRGRAVDETAAIVRLTSALHLTVGYAGYWDAASLQWSSNGRLLVHPLRDVDGSVQPSQLARVDGWYTPRPHTPSYLVLAPDDGNFPDRLPAALPRPARSFHLGAVTVDVYPFDLARYVAAPAAG